MKQNDSTSKSPPHAKARKFRFGLPAALFLLVTLLYMPSVRNGFVYDDETLILKEGRPDSVEDFTEIFGQRHFPTVPYYRPIPRLTFRLQHAIHGKDAAPFHAFNAVLAGLTAFDIIPLIAGSGIAKITAAREWQAFDVRSDSFRDAAQVMLELDNGCGVMGDISYSAPSTFGFTHPSYWRFTFWGTLGMVECNAASQTVAAYFDGENEPLQIPVDSENPKSYLDAFLDDLRGIPTELDTNRVLASARDALLIQRAANIRRGI